VALVGLDVAAPAAAAQSAQSSGAVEQYSAVVTQYCVGCHNERLKTAGLMLDQVDLRTAPAGEHAEVWERVVRKLNTGAMPPPGVRRPSQDALDGLSDWLEAELDRAALANPNPGRPLLHRMNRAEYGNAIRDILDLDVNVESLLPPDDSAFGFDNISDVLGLSPVRVERYVTAAEYISALAVGELDTAPGSETYRVRQDRSQDVHVEDAPLGTVGGLQIRHTFPLDAEYAFQVTLFRTNLDVVRGLEHPNDLEITVDGRRVFLHTIGGPDDQPGPGNTKETADALDARLQVRVPVQAGPHVIGAAFVQKLGVGTRRLQPFVRSSAGGYDATGRPHVNTLTVVGPFEPTGLGDTPSRRRIFSCRPADAATEAPCAREILTTLTRRAYRRPVTDTDLQPIMAFYEAGRQDGTFDTGIQRALQRILASPKFLVRVERDPEGIAPGSPYRISDLELASRLSFFLWGSIPDDELLAVATEGRLSDPAVLDAQVRRLLADTRSDALVTQFAGQWLQLRNLRNLLPDSETFPDFDDQLRESFARETELFFESIVREDRGVLDLLTADYTFVNERLARHYGIPYVYGSRFRRVTLTDEARRGLLGQGSVLTVTSHADRTAPVLRGKWILDNLVGTPPPPPPPDVSTDLEETPEGAPARTVRERMEVHRASPACASCHNLMDPLGLALEHFDAIGARRTHDAGHPIDASTRLSDGTAVDGAADLRAALLSRQRVLVSTVVEKLMTYALGRGLQYYDMPAIRAVVDGAESRNYRFSSIILGIVNSSPFQMRVSDSG
jgi:cytochrome c553